MTLVAAGCAMPRVLTAESVTVARLNPDPGDVPPDARRAMRYGVETLAERDVKDAALADRLRHAATDRGNRDGPARGRCFLPRFAVRVADGRRWTDYVICTQCRRMETHASDGFGDAFEISPAGCDVFDRLMAALFPGYPVRPVTDPLPVDQP